MRFGFIFYCVSFVALDWSTSGSEVGQLLEENLIEQLNTPPHTSNFVFTYFLNLCEILFDFFIEVDWVNIAVNCLIGVLYYFLTVVSYVIFLAVSAFCLLVLSSVVLIIIFIFLSGVHFGTFLLFRFLLAIGGAFSMGVALFFYSMMKCRLSIMTCYVASHFFAAGSVYGSAFLPVFPDYRDNISNGVGPVKPSSLDRPIDNSDESRVSWRRGFVFGIFVTVVVLKFTGII